MKKIISLVIGVLLLGTQLTAQEWTGTFTSNFGEIKLMTEGDLIYGEYNGVSTIVAIERKFSYGTKLIGIYENGTEKGKFYFEKWDGQKVIKGHYNPDNDVTLEAIKADPIFTLRFDFDKKYKWEGSKVNSNKPTTLLRALFNGQWNTNYGVLQLQQIGNKVTGTYRDLGEISATYNPATKKLEGTFTNKGNTGYFLLDAKLAGNGFSGKWGWNKAMAETDSWTWNKKEKTNGIATVTPRTSTQQNNSTTNNENEIATKRYRFGVYRAYKGETAVIRSPDLYGFASIKLFRVTESQRIEIKNFGNKSVYFFNLTEDNAPGGATIDFAENNANYYRDFIINTSDLNNDEVDIEVEIVHHLKGKLVGTNENYGYHKSVFNLEEIVLDKRPQFKGNFIVGEGCSNGDVYNCISENSSIIVNLKII
jgi:hypothetical protein